MKVAWLVAAREFREWIRSRGFLLSTLATPFFLVVMLLVSGRAASESEPVMQSLSELETRVEPTGYVDQAGLVMSVPPPLPDGLFRPYPDEGAAQEALRVGEITGYYLIPPNYRQQGSVRYVSLDLPASPPTTQGFDWLLAANLLSDLPADEAARIYWPFETPGLAFVNVDPQRPSGGFENELLPFMVTLAVVIPMLTSGSFLLQSLVREKTGRVLEILLISLRPRELLAGKLMGLGALTALQYLAWAVLGGLGLRLAGSSPAGLFNTVRFTRAEALFVVPFALGAYLLYASLMAGVGALTSDMESGRGWIFLLNAPIVVPLWLWTAIVSNPDGLLALALSLFPFSAPVAMIMRMTSTAVPAWQLLLSLGLLVLAGAGLLLVMARLFRVQTLLSGEPLSPRRFWTALRQG